jgi:hypothetical protein
MGKLSAVLTQLLNEEGINTSELARQTGTLQPVMHRLVTGDTDNPRITTLAPIAKYFGITLDQLVGIFPLPRHRKSQKNGAQPYSWSSIPLLSWSELSGALDASKKHPLIEVSCTVSEQAYALTVKDPTMSPRFIEGTLLIVEPNLTPDSGDFVIVELDPSHEPTFKQVFFDGGDIYLKPLNTDFKMIHLEKNADCRFLGVVVESKLTLKQRRDN